VGSRADSLGPGFPPCVSFGLITTDQGTLISQLFVVPLLLDFAFKIVTPRNLYFRDYGVYIIKGKNKSENKMNDLMFRVYAVMK
jgi:hypothetical protein